MKWNTLHAEIYYRQDKKADTFYLCNVQSINEECREQPSMNDYERRGTQREVLLVGSVEGSRECGGE